jgi:serine/threonine protein kinase
LTRTGLAVGTLAYMSPEQVCAGPVDARSDLYSLGLTFYEMVTGRRGMQGETDLALMNAQLTIMPPEPAAVNPLVPAGVSAVIMRAVAKVPDRRFQTASELQSALQDLRSPVTAEATTQPYGPVLDSDAVPAGELVELEARLSRIVGPIAKRLVGDAARRYRTKSEILRALADLIEDANSRADFLKPDGPAVTVGVHASGPPPSFDAGTIDRLTRAVAPYVGPIARILVIRAARVARSIEELNDAIAAEVPSADDRRRFLAAARSLL